MLMDAAYGAGISDVASELANYWVNRDVALNMDWWRDALQACGYSVLGNPAEVLVRLVRIRQSPRLPIDSVLKDSVCFAAYAENPEYMETLRLLDARKKELRDRLPTTLAEFAAENKTRLIHFSTDMVFDGKAENYAENSPPNPTNLYGEHKLESENRIQELYPEACIVRLPLLMGNSPAGTRSVHEALWSQWSQGATTPLFEDEWRTPVSVCNVASLTKELFIGTMEHLMM